MSKKVHAEQTVMKITKQAAVVEVVCLVDGIPVRIRLTPGTVVGLEARRRFSNFNNDELAAKLFALTQAITLNYVQKNNNIATKDLAADLQPLLLEMVRRADVLDKRMFYRKHSYCIVCTCTGVDGQPHHFHVAGLMDTTSVIAQQINTEADGITRWALQLIGSNAEYYDSKYDDNVALQELKGKAGGIHTCNCGMCSRTFVCVRIAAGGWALVVGMTL